MWKLPISYYLQVETLEKTNESFTVKLEMEKTAKRDARQTIEDLNNEISRVSKELKKTQNGNLWELYFQFYYILYIVMRHRP